MSARLLLLPGSMAHLAAHPLVPGAMDRGVRSAYPDAGPRAAGGDPIRRRAATIRRARPDEVDRVRLLEDEAGLRYAEAGLPGDLEGLDPAIVRAAIDAGLLHVLTDGDDVPVGFALCRVYPSALHLRELDVLPAWQGRGLGSRLIAHTLELARALGLGRVTLTTFRDVPFNAPYYRRRGFVELAEDQLPDWLAAIRRGEAEAGLDRWPRVAMGIDVPPHGSDTEARLAVAARLAPAWDLPDVAAIVVSGSTARGLADRWSDLELGVYWSRPPADAARDLAIARLGASLTRRVSRQTPPGWFGVDNLVVDGFQVDVAMNTVGAVDALVASVVDERDLRDDVVDLLGMLAEVRPLRGEAIVSGWKRRLALDEPLRLALVQHALQLLPASPVEIDRLRGNPVRILERQLSWAKCGLRAVYPLSGQWFPGLKAALARLDDLGAAPPRSRERVLRGLSGPTPEACETLVAWLDEVLDAAAAAGADVAAARERLHAPGRSPADPEDLARVGRGA